VLLLLALGHLLLLALGQWGGVRAKKMDRSIAAIALHYMLLDAMQHCCADSDFTHRLHAQQPSSIYQALQQV